ncbi:MAG: DUF1214 domain-containing protein, partial [Sphingomonadaceae bacterium]
GTREYLHNNYLYRMAGAVRGIYGNSKEEAIYSGFYMDSEGKSFNGASGRYRVHFTPEQLPQVQAFWSLTMYSLPDRMLVENPIKRYLINSSMLQQLRHDPDGGITLYIQHDPPGADKEMNWLPAPDGPFLIAARAYWPTGELLEDKWEKPPVERIE